MVELRRLPGIYIGYKSGELEGEKKRNANLLASCPRT
jgi:hypothetical protein